MSLLEVLRTYSKDYKVIFVGDASMASYEITLRGGSVKYMNEEPGYVWMQRLKSVFDKVIWLNPVDENYWSYTHSIGMVKKLVEEKMYPLSVRGIGALG